MDVLFKGLPQTKKNKNLKKALTVKPAVKGWVHQSSLSDLNSELGPDCMDFERAFSYIPVTFAKLWPKSKFKSAKID